MDEVVLRSLVRWPDVPACYGWLSLDRSGRWRLQGDVVRHRGLAEFIGRNYLNDEAGQWFFQNGPQRVYVALDYTPWVFGWNAATPNLLISHTGRTTNARAAFVDEHGALLIDTDLGIGLLASQDLVALSDQLQLGDDLRRGTLALGERTVLVHPIQAAEVAARFHFNPSPTSQA
ncbi:DUF2946 family protein [Niveibacterium sp.]|uniref:DUF2946 family protein n=1 Tax=Niveibacterium sp. TaxID=2017444 RepID=UPI0035AF0C4E